MVNEFGTFKLNSIIHSDNGSEFKSFQYRLATIWFDFGLSMSIIVDQRTMDILKVFEALLKEKHSRRVINTML